MLKRHERYYSYFILTEKNNEKIWFFIFLRIYKYLIQSLNHLILAILYSQTGWGHWLCSCWTNLRIQFQWLGLLTVFPKNLKPLNHPIPDIVSTTRYWFWFKKYRFWFKKFLTAESLKLTFNIFCWTAVRLNKTQFYIISRFYGFLVDLFSPWTWLWF